MVYSYGPSTGPYFPDKKSTKKFCLGKPTTIIEREKLNQQAAIYFREKTTGERKKKVKVFSNDLWLDVNTVTTKHNHPFILLFYKDIMIGCPSMILSCIPQSFRSIANANVQATNQRT